MEERLTITEVAKEMRWSRSTYYNRVKSGDFPPPITTGPRTRLYLRKTINDYLAGLQTTQAIHK